MQTRAPGSATPRSRGTFRWTALSLIVVFLIPCLSPFDEEGGITRSGIRSVRGRQPRRSDQRLLRSGDAAQAAREKNAQKAQKRSKRLSLKKQKAYGHMLF